MIDMEELAYLNVDDKLNLSCTIMSNKSGSIFQQGLSYMAKDQFYWRSDPANDRTLPFTTCS